MSVSRLVGLTHRPQPPSATMAAFCLRHVLINRGDRQGQLRLDPHQVQPMEDSIDPLVSEVILAWSSQLGKSVILPARIAWANVEEPEDILLMLAGDKNIDKFIREKLRAVLMACREAWRRIHLNNRGQFSRHGFDFDGGGITITTPRSVGGEHGNSTPLVLMDEVDDYPPEFELDGLLQRGISFRRSKIIAASAVAKSGPSHIWRRYELGHQAWRYVPCVHCGCYQTLSLAMVREGAIICVDCERAWTEGDRQASLPSGEWRAQNPSAPAGRRSYWCSQLYSVQIPLARTLDSLAGMSTAHISTQIEAWPYEEHEIAPVDPERIRRAIRDWDAPIRTIGVDVQVDRLIWYAVDFADDLGRAHVVAMGYVPRSAETPRVAFFDLRRAVSSLGAQQLTCDIGYDPDGTLDGLHAAWPDAFRSADTAVEGVRGSAQAGGTFGQPLRGVWRTAGWFIGAVDEGKSLVHGDANSGQLSLEPTLPASVAAEIAAERCIRQADHRGNVRLRWVNPDSKPNHALDCLVYAYMGALKVQARRLRGSVHRPLAVAGIR